MPLPLESYDWAKLSECSHHATNAKSGIVFMLRAKNEEDNIGEAIESIHRHLSNSAVHYQIVCINNDSDDQTEHIAKQHLREDDVYYDYPIRLAKAGLENYVTPCNSAHSLPWFYQWCYEKCTKYSHVFKWDADFRMNEPLARYLVDEFSRPLEELADTYHIRTISEDMIETQECYVWARRTNHFFSRWTAYETVQSEDEETKRHVPQHIKIEHRSTLKQVKSYFRLDPWWTSLDDQMQTLPHVQSTKRRYNRLLTLLGCDQQLFTRSGDQVGFLVMRAMHRHLARIVGVGPYRQQDVSLSAESDSWRLLGVLAALSDCGEHTVCRDARVVIIGEKAIGQTQLHDWIATYQLEPWCVYFDRVGKQRNEAALQQGHRRKPSLALQSDDNEAEWACLFNAEMCDWSQIEFLVCALPQLDIEQACEFVSRVIQSFDVHSRRTLGVVFCKPDVAIDDDEDTDDKQAKVQMKQTLARQLPSFIICETPTMWVAIQQSIEFCLPDGIKISEHQNPTHCIAVDNSTIALFTAPDYKGSMADALKRRFC